MSSKEQVQYRVVAEEIKEALAERLPTGRLSLEFECCGDYSNYLFIWRAGRLWFLRPFGKVLIAYQYTIKGAQRFLVYDHSLAEPITRATKSTIEVILKD